MSQIFTKSDMWQCAVETMGTEAIGIRHDYAIVLLTPEDVEQLYNALKKAHEEAVDFYERGLYWMRGLYRPVAKHLAKFCNEGEFVIYRDDFRWKRYHEAYYWNEDFQQWEDEVLSNHYNGMSLEQLAEDFGYEIDWDTNLHHVAIVRKK